MKKSRALTLIEILGALLILSIVILTAGTIYVSAMKEFERLSELKTVQSETLFALDHIYARLIGAEGIETASFPSGSIVVITDFGVDPEPDERIRYSLSFNDETNRWDLDYDPPYNTAVPDPADAETIATYITSLTFNRPLETEEDSTINNYITIDITAQRGVGARVASQTLSTGVTLRGMPG